MDRERRSDLVGTDQESLRRWQYVVPVSGQSPGHLSEETENMLASGSTCLQITALHLVMKCILSIIYHLRPAFYDSGRALHSSYFKGPETSDDFSTVVA